MCVWQSAKPKWAKDVDQVVAYKMMRDPAYYGYYDACRHPRSPHQRAIFPIGKKVRMRRVNDMEMLRTHEGEDRGIFAFRFKIDALRIAQKKNYLVFRVHLSGRVIAYDNSCYYAGYRAEECTLIEVVKR